jgi:isopropylmalate/homocitrate/citramalate synthase
VEFSLTDETLREGDSRGYHQHSPESRLALVKLVQEITGIRSFSMGFAAVGPTDRQTLLLFLEACRRGTLQPDSAAHVFAWNRGEPRVHALLSSLSEEDHARIDLQSATCVSEPLVRYQDGPWLLEKTGSKEPIQSVDRKFLFEGLANAYREITSGFKKYKLNSLGMILLDAFRAKTEDIELFIQAGLDGGATEIRLQDSVGIATPTLAAERVNHFKRKFPHVPIFVHFHNDFGLATANTLAAFEAGASGGDVSTNGLGNRAGNAVTAEVLMGLYKLYGYKMPGVQYERLMELSRAAERHYALPQSPFAPVTGRLLHLDEASYRTHMIHTIPEPTYLPYPPAEVGGKFEGAHTEGSGRAAVELLLERERSRLAQAGITVDPGLTERAYAWVLRERAARAETWRPRALAQIEQYEETIRSSYVTDADIMTQVLETGGRFG